MSAIHLEGALILFLPQSCQRKAPVEVTHGTRSALDLVIPKKAVWSDLHQTYPVCKQIICRPCILTFDNFNKWKGVSGGGISDE